MNKEIVIYGKKMCTQCVQVKMMLELNGVQYQYEDIEDNSEALDEVLAAKAEYGISELPFIKVNGDFLIPSGLTGAKLNRDLLC